MCPNSRAPIKIKEEVLKIIKNKKTVFGTIILLFALIGICNIQSVFGLEDPDYAVTLDAGETFTVGANLNFGEIVRIEYEITETEADLHFYIKNSNDETIENHGHVVGYGLYHFYVPYDDYFRINFRNDCIFAHRHLQLNLDIIEQKTITITLPNTLSIFTQGDNYMYWTSTGAISYVTIDLCKDGYFLEKLTTWTSNDGIYNIYIYTDEYIDGSNYQIKITDYYDSSIYDYSANFTIECKSESKIITITSPISTDTFSSGYNYITWTTIGDVSSYVRIDLYKNGDFLETITSGVYNTDSYSWYINGNEYVNCSYYQIKISESYDHTIYGYSDYFTIEIEPEPDSESKDKTIGIDLIPLIAIISLVTIVPLIIITKKRNK